MRFSSNLLLNHVRRLNLSRRDEMYGQPFVETPNIAETGRREYPLVAVMDPDHSPHCL